MLHILNLCSCLHGLSRFYDLSVINTNFYKKRRSKAGVNFKNIILQGNFWEFHSHMKVDEVFAK